MLVIDPSTKVGCISGCYAWFAVLVIDPSTKVGCISGRYAWYVSVPFNYARIKIVILLIDVFDCG